MHPANLAALASTWSLTASLAKLRQAAADEAADHAALASETRDGLRSARYGGTRAAGGHGDPVGDTCMGASTTQPTPYANLYQAVGATLQWLADQLHLPEGPDSLERIRVALPPLTPELAATLNRWLDENDRRIRARLRLPTDLWPVLGNPACPACNVRQLYARTSAPSGAWPIVCAANCTCTGPACPCGMPVRAAGAPHIWAPGSALVEQSRANVAA